MQLTNEERETHLSVTAADRHTWHIYSDDEVMQRRLEAAGAVVSRVSKDGIGKHYTMRSDQITFRKGKRTLSDEQRAQLADRMRALHSAKATA